MPAWFADAVDRMGRPDLPAFDPDAALDGTAATPGTGTTTSRDSGTRSTRRSGSGGASGSDDETPDHPLSDVWGE